MGYTFFYFALLRQASYYECQTKETQACFTTQPAPSFFKSISQKYIKMISRQFIQLKHIKHSAFSVF